MDRYAIEARAETRLWGGGTEEDGWVYDVWDKATGKTVHSTKWNWNREAARIAAVEWINDNGGWECQKKF